MTSNADQKLADYVQLLERWNDQLHAAGNWIDALNLVLRPACRLCRGDVFYSLHSILPAKNATKGLIRFELGGPPELFERRADTTDTDLDKGCIGHTLKEGLPFLRFPDVHKVPEYKEANPKTNSELVVVVPRALGAGAHGVINLESSEVEAFDSIDELFFAVLAGRVALLEEFRYALKCRDILTKGLTRALDEVTSHRHFTPDLVQLFQILAEAVRMILPADAICVVRYEPLPGAQDNDLEVDFDDGYDPPEKWKARFKQDKHTFSFDVIRADEPLIENVKASGDQYHLRRYRSRTAYAMGTVLRRSGGSTTALVLEFDQPREESRARDIESLERVRTILVSLMDQHESAREAASVQRALDALRQISSDAQAFDNIDELLKRSAPQIVSSLHSSACGFYRIDKSPDGTQRLTELAFSRKPDTTDPNVEWGNWLNRKWQERIRLETENQGFSDFGEPLEPPADRPVKRWHRVFAKRVNLFGDEPNVLFLSVKAVDERRYRTLRLTPTSHKILDAELAQIQIAFSKEAMRIQREAFARALEYSLRMGFEAVSLDQNPAMPKEARKLSKEEQAAAEARLLGRLHLLLEQWVPIRTSHSAIFRLEGSVLVMHDATLKHLRERAADRSGLAVPLKLSAETPGLTSRVLREPKGVMSLRVNEEGSEVCREFWEKVTGAPSVFRFFAGVLIPGPDGQRPYGVLTLNGRQPPHYHNMPIEARWQALPVLGIIAAELGRELALIGNNGKRGR